MNQERLKYKKEWAKNKRENCKKDGICADCCCRPVAVCRSRCEFCLEKHKNNTRSRKTKRIEEHKCFKCGTKCLKKWCDACCKNNTEIGRNRRKALQNKGLCGVCGNPKPCVCSEKLRKKREECKSQGLCTSCGTKPNNGFCERCDICIFKNIAQSSLKNRSKWKFTNSF